MPTSIAALHRRRSARVIRRLMAELDAGRFDSPEVQQLVRIPGGQMRMLRALALAEAGLLARAREDVEACLAQCQGRVSLVWAAGIVLFVTRDYHRSLECLFEAARDPQVASKVYRQICIFAGSLGWEEDVRRASSGAIDHDPTELWWQNQAAHMHLRGRNYRQALVHVEEALALDPMAFQLHMQRAKLLGELGDFPRAAAAIEAGLAISHEPGPERSEAAGTFTSVGSLERARELLLEVHAAKPKIENVVELGRLALWVNDHQQVLRWAGEAEKIDPRCAGAARLRGAVAVRTGDFEAAIEPLEFAIASDPREFEAHVWRAEAALRLADYETVYEHLHQASMKASGFLFVCGMLRFIAVAQQHQFGEGKIYPHRSEEFIRAVGELCPGSEPIVERGNERELVALIEKALGRLGGNRTPIATQFDPETGRVTRLKTRSGARYSSRHALQLIRVMPATEVLAELTNVVAQYPHSSLPMCHRGELWLWLGNLERAREDLEKTIEILHGTRWAYIGLTGIEILEGNYEKALEVSARGVDTMRGTEGPSVYIYRGEALRRLGRCGEALVDLTRSVRIHPSRVSAWFNLGLVYAASGEVDLFEKVYARLEIQAPGLLSDAAREVEVVLWGDLGFVPSVEERVAVLEHGLAMMRGNRSSTAMTYFTAEGRMRMVEHRDAGTPAGQGPHVRDRTMLARAHNLVLGTLGLTGAPEPEVRVTDVDLEREVLAWFPELPQEPAAS